MSGIWQGDVVIKALLDLGIEEMRRNPWLVQHALSSLKSTEYFSDKYGQKNIDACIEWLTNNKIDVYMRPRNDKDQLPCVTITPGNTPEKPEMKHMADLSVERIILLPLEIGKPIPYVIKPFTPISYDSSTGEIGVPDTVNLLFVSAGMVVVNPSTGDGFVIQDVQEGVIVVEADLNINATQLAVVPQHSYYKARIEHTFFQDSYTISCEAHGDPQTLIWLHTIVLYTILRYRESLLEGNGFAESSVSSSEIMVDEGYGGQGDEQAFIRLIQLTGQVENSWIKAPHRYIENIAIVNREDCELSGGIKILSNLDASEIITAEDPNWLTVEDTPTVTNTCPVPDDE